MNKNHIETESSKQILRLVKKYGTQQKLARLLGKKQQNISIWINEKYPPSDICLKIVRLDNSITLSELNPDLYPKDIFGQ